MKTSTCKAKGRRLQNEVRDIILNKFPQLEPDDCKVAVMGESGEDIKLSPAARKLFPYSIECKNQEKLNIWSALNQAESNNKDNTKPILVFHRNRSETYVALKLADFIEMVS